MFERSPNGIGRHSRQAAIPSGAESEDSVPVHEKIELVFKDIVNRTILAQIVVQLFTVVDQAVEIRQAFLKSISCTRGPIQTDG